MEIHDDLVFIDTETLGLDLNKHDVWEIGWAVGEGPVRSVQVSHNILNADEKALEVNRYLSRLDAGSTISQVNELIFRSVLKGKTLVGANPAFDAYRLERRWGVAPWHYRLIDVESMAVPLFDMRKPLGLSNLVLLLRDNGFEIPDNDHSAAGDVATVREVYRALMEVGRKNSWVHGS